jgi:hypothetical protein
MTKDATRVIVTHRKMGENLWFAQIKGKPGTKVSGKTQVEAVGRLVIAKHGRLRLQIKRDETKDL